MKLIRTQSVAVATAVSLVVGGGVGGAIAANQIDGASIERDSVAYDRLTKRAQHTIRNGGSITAGSLRMSRLSKGTQRLIRKAGRSGPAGAAGQDGATGSGPAGPAGPAGQDGATGATGPAGAPGRDGADGTNGTDGASAGAPVRVSGDSGWTVGGSGAGAGGVNAQGDGATFRGGALHIPAGFDATTTTGAIGAVKAYDNVPLSQLSALTYDYIINRAGGGEFPSVHVSVMGASYVAGGGGDSKFPSGFTNLVFNPGLPRNRTPYELQRSGALDALNGGSWYATGRLPISASGGLQDPLPWATFVARNPNAQIVQISFDNAGTAAGGNPSDATDFAISTAVVGFGGTFTRYAFGG